MFDGFSGGYQSSSISQSSNSQLKRLLPIKQITLTEIREFMNVAEELSFTTRRYIKGKKLKKKKSLQILEIMKTFNISEPISDAICGQLAFEEKFIVNENGCSCKKQQQVGLPYSHFIKLFIKKRIKYI